MFVLCASHLGIVNKNELISDLNALNPVILKIDHLDFPWHRILYEISLYDLHDLNAIPSNILTLFVTSCLADTLQQMALLEQQTGLVRSALLLFHVHKEGFAWFIAL